MAARNQSPAIYDARPVDTESAFHKLDVEGFTWHNISQWLARILLIGFTLFWLHVMIVLIEPHFLYTATSGCAPPATNCSMTSIPIIIEGSITTFFAIVLAIGCAIVPAIFLSSLIASSPANQLLNKLLRKYGSVGYGFAMFGAVIFIAAGFYMLEIWWSSRPFIRDHVLSTSYAQWKLAIIALMTQFLTTGFPAWALNVMTPKQWIAAVKQIRAAAYIDRITEIEGIIHDGLVARAYALVHADVAKMTAAEFGQTITELGGMLAGSEQQIAKQFKLISGAMQELYGFTVATSMDADDDIIDRYGMIVDALSDGYEILRDSSDDIDHYVELTANQTATALGAASPTALTVQNAAAERLSARMGHRPPTHRPAPITVTEMAPPIQDVTPTVMPPVEPLDAQKGDPVTVLTPQNSQPETALDGLRRSLGKHYYDHYITARKKLDRPWTVTDICLKTGLQNRQAWRVIRAWMQAAPPACAETEVKGTYCWTDLR